jgi:hypothetical protein
MGCSFRRYTQPDNLPYRILIRILFPLTAQAGTLFLTDGADFIFNPHKNFIASK